MRTYFIFLLTLATYLQGCAVIKDVESYKTERLDKNNYSKLNGMYSNIHSDTTVISYNDFHGFAYRPKTLWSHTYSFNKDKEKGNAEAQTVRLEFKTQKKILLSLYEKDSLISNREIRGRIKDGFFYRKPHFVLIPLIPIVVSYDTYRYRIALVKDGLVIDYKWNYWGFALLAGGSGKGQTSTTFKKK